METKALLEFNSHIGGKNAKVSIFADRVEWLKPRGASGGKIAAGIFTGGASLLVTGVRNSDSGTEMVPIKSISSVTTKRDGPLNSKVVVIVSGNTIEFRVSHSEAEIVKTTLTQLILGTHPALSAKVEQVAASQAPAASSAPASSNEPDLVSQIKKLGELKDAGLLTEEEFSQKKAQLLERM
jgi:hypothetical protein